MAQKSTTTSRLAINSKPQQYNNFINVSKNDALSLIGQNDNFYLYIDKDYQKKRQQQ